MCRIHSMQMPCVLSCQEEAGQAEADAEAAAESQVLRDLSDCRPNLDDQLNVLFHSWEVCLSNGWRDMLASLSLSKQRHRETPHMAPRRKRHLDGSAPRPAPGRPAPPAPKPGAPQPEASQSGASESCGPWQPLGAPSSSRGNGWTPLVFAA